MEDPETVAEWAKPWSDAMAVMEPAPVMKFSEGPRSAIPIEDDFRLLHALPLVVDALTLEMLKSFAVMVESVTEKLKSESRMPADAALMPIAEAPFDVLLELEEMLVWLIA